MTGPGSGGLRSSTAPLCSAYDVALLDLDGVIYVGEVGVPHAAEALREARAGGMRAAFVTNNASRTPQQVADRLAALDVVAEPGDIVTSAQAAAHLLADMLPAGSPVLVVGGEGLHQAVIERGLRPVAALADGPAAVVQGFDEQLGWAALAEACYAVASGLPWVATNLDMTLPTPRGLAPGNGSLVQVVRTVTGKQPVAAGKPAPPLHRETVERTGATHPLVVGDRLDTDIAGARNAGTDSLLVLTGVTAEADLLGLAADARPSYLGRDLRSLLRPAPRVHADERSASCAGWQVLLDGRPRVLAPAAGAAAATGPDEPDGRMHALRAVCALSWARLDAGLPGLGPEVLDLLPELGDDRVVGSNR